MGIDAFRFDGKRALVVGGASGMGEAAASSFAISALRSSSSTSWTSTPRA